MKIEKASQIFSHHDTHTYYFNERIQWSVIICNNNNTLILLGKTLKRIWMLHENIKLKGSLEYYINSYHKMFDWSDFIIRKNEQLEHVFASTTSLCQILQYFFCGEIQLQLFQEERFDFNGQLFFALCSGAAVFCFLQNRDIWFCCKKNLETMKTFLMTFYNIQVLVWDFNVEKNFSNYIILISMIKDKPGIENQMSFLQNFEPYFHGIFILKIHDFFYKKIFTIISFFCPLESIYSK